MRESYAGEEGERFFRAIVREAFVDTPVDDMTVRQAYQRMITTLDDLIGRAREKTLLSSFFALMPPTH